MKHSELPEMTALEITCCNSIKHSKNLYSYVYTEKAKKYTAAVRIIADALREQEDYICTPREGVREIVIFAHLLKHMVYEGVNLNTLNKEACIQILIQIANYIESTKTVARWVSYPSCYKPSACKR